MTEETADALAGTNAGCTDIFLLKYDSSGSQQWIKQIGTSDGMKVTMWQSIPRAMCM
jgi:hypothetical protein